MGNLRAALAASVVCLFACSSKNNTAVVDAPVIPDAPPDAPPDSPPDAPVGDFSCLNATAGTTADDPITIAGLTGTFGTGGLSAVPNVVVDVFKTGVATKLDEVKSDVNGAFTTANLVTDGKPLSGFLEASLTGSRTTFVFPSAPFDASVAGIPVALVDTATFDTIANAVDKQDDTVNGAMLILVTDCAGMRLDKADVKVTQAGKAVGTVFYLGGFAQQAIGVYFVFNVPDGATDVTAKFANMQFATHTVIAFKKNDTDIASGSITATNILPGP